jgi:hypothetical protein
MRLIRIVMMIARLRMYRYLLRASMWLAKFAMRFGP